MRTLSRLLIPFAILLLGASGLGGAGAAPAAGKMVGLVINENGNSIVAIDPETRGVIGTLETGGVLNKPHLAYYHAATGRLFIANKGANLAVYDVRKPLEPKLVANVKPGGDGEMHWLDAGGGLIWLAHEGDSAIYAFDPADPTTPKARFGKEHGLDTTHGAAMRPGTAELWVTNRPANAPGTIVRIDTAKRAIIGQPLRTTGANGDRPNNVGFTPDGRWAYAVNTGNNATQITLIDASTFTVVKQIDQDAKQGLSPHALIYHPGTKRFFVANQNGNTVSALDTATNSVAGYIPIGQEPHGVSVGPDGLIYASARRGNEISLIDPQSLAVVAKIMTPAIVGPHQIIFLEALPGTPRTGAGGGQARPAAPLAVAVALGGTLLLGAGLALYARRGRRLPG
jgi:YVTN family beta-propeller protein